MQGSVRGAPGDWRPYRDGLKMNELILVKRNRSPPLHHFFVK